MTVVPATLTNIGIPAAGYIGSIEGGAFDADAFDYAAFNVDAAGTPAPAVLTNIAPPSPATLVPEV